MDDDIDDERAFIGVCRIKPVLSMLDDIQLDVQIAKTQQISSHVIIAFQIAIVNFGVLRIMPSPKEIVQALNNSFPRPRVDSVGEKQ